MPGITRSRASIYCATSLDSVAHCFDATAQTLLFITFIRERERGGGSRKYRGLLLIFPLCYVFFSIIRRRSCASLSLSVVFLHIQFLLTYINELPFVCIYGGNRRSPRLSFVFILLQFSRRATLDGLQIDANTCLTSPLAPFRA